MFMIRRGFCSTYWNWSLSSVDANVNDCRNVLNAFLTTVFQPFGNYCGNAVEIEHHNIVLLISWVVKSIQYGFEYVVKQSLENDF